MKYKLTALLGAVLISVFLASSDIKAEETAPAVSGESEQKQSEEIWDYENDITYQDGAFTYCTIPSKDRTKAWIYEVKIDQDQEHSKLSFPDHIEGMTVVQLGYTIEMEEDKDDEFRKNIYGKWVEFAHDYDGGYDVKGIKEIIIPDTVEIIRPTTFSGSNEITSITIPKNIKSLEKETFYGCNRLKEIYLPAGLETLDVKAFSKCPKLAKIKFIGKNKIYKTKKRQSVYQKRKRTGYGIFKS